VSGREPLAEIETQANWLKPATGQLNYAGFFSASQALFHFARKQESNFACSCELGCKRI